MHNTVSLYSPPCLDRTLFPRRYWKKKNQVVKPLAITQDLAHTLDKKFVLAYPPPPLLQLPPLSFLLGMVQGTISDLKTTIQGIPRPPPPSDLPLPENPPPGPPRNPQEGPREEVTILVSILGKESTVPGSLGY